MEVSILGIANDNSGSRIQLEANLRVG